MSAVRALEEVPERADNSTLFNDQITRFGRRIFNILGQEKPSTFNKNYWAGRIMEWSMLQPEFKLNMFRLVDVLPNLRNSGAIARHVSEYLGDVVNDLPGVSWLGRWGLKGTPDSLRAKALALVVKHSVNEMAGMFIAGETPKEALRNLRKLRANKLAYTVDLLGEFCVSEREAEVYVDRYLEALDVLGAETPQWGESAPIVPGHPGDQSPTCISVKLSALYSQCSPLNFERSVGRLSEKLSTIVRRAQKIGASLYVDAEDSGNNPIIYASYKRVFGSAEFKNFPYPGIVVQAYSKGAQALIEDLLTFAARRGTPIAIRLVKGAYWDHETIACKQQNWESPLFAHKSSSDANFEHLTRVLLDNHEVVLPAFGSHNIRSLAHACCYAQAIGLSERDYELQMLYGMAEPIAQAFSRQGNLVRMYVPLGDMLVGMGYLVRRLLENTSNESFLRHTFFEKDKVDELLAVPQFHPEDIQALRG